MRTRATDPVSPHHQPRSLRNSPRSLLTSPRSSRISPRTPRASPRASLRASPRASAPPSIGSQLGQGDFGTTFLDPENTDRVIKRVTFNTANTKGALLSEIAVQRELSQDSLAPKVYNVWDAGESMYYSMQRMHPITDWHKAMPQLKEVVVKMLRRGFVHNDLHQGNIMQTSKGKLLPIDFGLCRRIQTDLEKTELDMVCIAQMLIVNDKCNENNKKNLSSFAKPFVLRLKDIVRDAEIFTYVDACNVEPYTKLQMYMGLLETLAIGSYNAKDDRICYQAAVDHIYKIRTVDPQKATSLWKNLKLRHKPFKFPRTAT